MSSSSSDLLSDEGSEDALFITSSILAGFSVLLFLLRGFLFRELAYTQEEALIIIIYYYYLFNIKPEVTHKKAFY